MEPNNHTHTYIHTYTHTHIHIHPHIYIHSNTYTHILTYTYTQTQTSSQLVQKLTFFAEVSIRQMTNDLFFASNKPRKWILLLLLFRLRQTRLNALALAETFFNNFLRRSLAHVLRHTRSLKGDTSCSWPKNLSRRNLQENRKLTKPYF